MNYRTCSFVPRATGTWCYTRAVIELAAQPERRHADSEQKVVARDTPSAAQVNECCRVAKHNCIVNSRFYRCHCIWSI